MSVGGTHRYPLELLVNYWEIQPSLYGKHLDHLIRRGVKHIASFVPWQALESDITHSLPRFLQAIAERKLTLSLILTPEVGTHFPNAGIPKDLLKEEHLAKHTDGSVVACNLPPGYFALPSLYSQEFKKRYFSYLSKIDSLLADLSRNQSALSEQVNLVLTGSFWKHYRSPKASSGDAFGGLAGDYSNAASLAYRQHMDQYYLQREFVEGNSLASPLATSRWKDRAQEDTNRAFFQQQSEEVFRNRTYQQLRRKSSHYSLEETELYTPEADPSLFFDRFLGSLGQDADKKTAVFSKLSALIDESVQRISLGCHDRTRARIHWTRMGNFGSTASGGLTDSEKQFLILKSLLLMGGEGGGILVDEKDWFALSQPFRTRVEMLAQHLAQGDVKTAAPAHFWTPHLWSKPHPLWDELRAAGAGVGVKLISSLDAITQSTEGVDSRLVVVDPKTVMNRESVLKLIALARSGRVVALARSPLFTDAARLELEKACAGTKHLEIDLGLSYRLHVVGGGRIVIFDLPSQGASSSAMATFSRALFAIAELEPLFDQMNAKASAGFEIISMQKRLGGIGLFIFNSKMERATGEVVLKKEAVISDLGRALAGLSATEGAVLETRTLPIEISALGVVPLSLDFVETVSTSPDAPQPLSTQMDDHGTDLRLV